jgi:hypothetical protein
MGSVCEANAIRQEIYKKSAINPKYRVVLFKAEHDNYVPVNLDCYHRFKLYDDDAFPALLAWLRQGESSDRDTGKSHDSRALSWPAAALDYKTLLADRKTEFEIVKEVLAGMRPERILLIKGQSGSGKTWLLGEILDYSTHVGIAHTRHDFKGCPPLSELFETMRLDLGQGVLKTAFESSDAARAIRIISDLQQHRFPLLLVFDTYEQASEEASKWLETQLLPRLQQAPGVVVVVGGQEVPNPIKYRWHRLSVYNELDWICRGEDWLEYCRQKWQCPKLTVEDVNKFTIAAKGKPNLLAMLLENLVLSPQNDWN